MKLMILPRTYKSELLYVLDSTLQNFLSFKDNTVDQNNATNNDGNGTIDQNQVGDDNQVDDELEGLQETRYFIFLKNV